MDNVLIAQNMEWSLLIRDLVLNQLVPPIRPSHQRELVNNAQDTKGHKRKERYVVS